MSPRRAMNHFNDHLKEQLAGLEREQLRRELRRIDSAQGPAITIAGESFRNFSSNDYLGLAGHSAIQEAAIRAIEQFGAGSGASRLICGSLAPHHELEETLASFKGVEAALTFSSGYAAAVGTIAALIGKDDVIVIDKLVHASIVDAARLSGATMRVFDHNDPESLEQKLKWAASHPGKSGENKRILIVTESVFSMDGDLAPLRNIVELKERYGAWLMLDEAHATGLFGAQRRGLAEACELAGQVEIHMGTLGKALGSSGGYICGSRALIDFLINRARSFIFSTAPVPAASAAARAAIQLVQSLEGEERRVRVWSLVDQFKNALVGTRRAALVQSPIVPIVVGDSAAALALAGQLRARGFFVPAIRYPTVPRNAARLRVTITAAHTPEDVRALAASLGD
jgi:8-amino-7-oxononanoate synthase